MYLFAFLICNYLIYNNNNNNIYLLKLGCHPVAVVILHVHKTWNWLLLNLSLEGYMRSMYIYIYVCVCVVNKVGDKGQSCRVYRIEPPPTHTHTRESSWNPNSSTSEPDRPRLDRSVAGVITQQYSSVTFVSLRFHARKKEKNRSALKLLANFAIISCPKLRTPGITCTFRIIISY